MTEPRTLRIFVLVTVAAALAAADPRTVVSRSRLEEDPRLKIMWAGYAFAIDFRQVALRDPRFRPSADGGADHP